MRADLWIAIVDIDPTLQRTSRDKGHRSEDADELAAIGCVGIEFFIRIDFAQDVRVFG